MVWDMKKKILLSIILAMWLAADSICSCAFTETDIETLYAFETDSNVKSMGIKMLRKELGLDPGSDARTIGTFSRSTNDYITMTSLVNAYRQTVRDVTDSSFVLRLGKSDHYDTSYYTERAMDLDLLLYHLNVVKDATQNMDDKDKAAFINAYICNSFSFNRYCDTAPSAVSGFKTGITNCRGYTACFYIMGRNCGLNVSAECAHNKSGTHTYNVLYIDGAAYVVDSSANDLYNTNDYLLVPYASYMTNTHSTKIQDSLSDLEL